MFEELNMQAEMPHRLVVFGLQQCLVPITAAIIGVFLLGPIAPRGGDAALEWPKSMLYAYPALIGFLQAYIVRAKWRDTPRTGRWIGVAPALYWAYSIFGVETKMPFSVRLAQEFAPSGATEGLVLAFETLPVLACVCYSVQMLFFTRSAAMKAQRPDLS